MASSLNSYGVTFDMDGVLVDSYHAHFKSWVQMADADGLTYTLDDFDATFGRISREIIIDLWGNGLSETQIESMEDEKERLYREIIAADFPGMPGMSSVLHDLKSAGFGLAVGSSGPLENLHLVLEKLQAEELFDVVVTRNDVKEGKPHPEVFEKAAQGMGLSPARVAVVEDAPLGIQAAHAAGCRAVGLASTGRTPEMLHAADLVVSAIDSLSPQILRDLIDGKLELDSTP